MTCEHLVCALCAGPVVEGRCATCRASRAQVHAPSFVLTPQLFAVLVALLALLTVLLAHVR
jgi:hypothetical protein